MAPLLLPPAAGFIQFDVKIGDWEENLASVRRHLAALPPSPGSLVVLPELWATGFAYPHLAELAAITPALLTALQGEAKTYGLLLAGSLIEYDRQAGAFFNTLTVCGPDGSYGSYRKQQLFAPMGEDQHFTRGDNPQAIETPFGPVACLVCFDLRFPELAQQQVRAGARLIVVSAQWPASRLPQWRSLLKARAIENQAFVVAANRCGTTDGTGFAGRSTIIDPQGRVVIKAGNQPQTALAPLDASLLTKVRGKFQTAGLTPYRHHDARKVMALDTLQGRLPGLKAAGCRLVFTNGCFDILHQGHVSYLEEARRQGDCLIVGLNSDASIRAIKGPGRPVNAEDSRARVLAALGCVDYVVIFGEETPQNLITTILPDVLVKGADWPLEKIVGAAEVMARGGQVLTIPMVSNFSTTGLIHTIRHSRPG